MKMEDKRLSLQSEIELLRTIVKHIVQDGELYEDNYKQYALKKVENIKKLIELV